MKSIGVIQAKFSRFNLNSEHTFSSKNLNDDIKDLMKREVNLLPEEKMAVCYFENSLYWWVITDFRLIINDSEDKRYLDFSDIKKVVVKDTTSENSSKIDRLSLDLLTTDGPLELKVEKGTWHAMYNIVKFLRA